MYGKLRHRPKTFIRVQDSILLFSSSNLSNNKEVGIYPAAHTLFSFQLISRVLEVQMSSFFVVEKLRQLPTTFMNRRCSNFDVSNDVLASQQYQ